MVLYVGIVCCIVCWYCMLVLYVNSGIGVGKVVEAKALTTQTCFYAHESQTIGSSKYVLLPGIEATKGVHL